MRTVHCVLLGREAEVSDRKGEIKIRLLTCDVFSAFFMANIHSTKAMPISKTPM